MVNVCKCPIISRVPYMSGGYIAGFLNRGNFSTKTMHFSQLEILLQQKFTHGVFLNLSINLLYLLGPVFVGCENGEDEDFLPYGDEIHLTVFLLGGVDR